jgi:anhydro-N-acetylmuramic acid kinase
MYYIGLMSGTSMDAIDAALVEFNNKTTLKFYREYPIDNSIRHQVRLINEKSDLGHIADLDHELGHLFAKAVNDLLEEAEVKPKQVKAIGNHGQTILHKPNTTHKTSIQISDPNIICAETGITTVADFRRMDMAYGGQGAPLASAFHQYQFQQHNKATVILNIGGIANITLLPNNDSEIIGFDTGPGNGLLDDWIQLNKDEEYDKDCEWASSGNVNNALLMQLLNDEYFSLPAPKSTGREYFNLDWLKGHLLKHDSEISAEDTQATLLMLSATTISDVISKYAKDYNEVLVCGGGAYNLLLMKTLQDLLPNINISTTEKYGLGPDCIEAVTFAWLAKQRIENKTSNLPSVTGANKDVILGGVYSPPSF